MTRHIIRAEQPDRTMCNEPVHEAGDVATHVEVCMCMGYPHMPKNDGIDWCFYCSEDFLRMINGIPLYEPEEWVSIGAGDKREKKVPPFCSWEN